VEYWICLANETRAFQLTQATLAITIGKQNKFDKKHPSLKSSTSIRPSNLVHDDEKERREIL